MKQSIFNSTLVLTIVCVVCSGLLGYSYTATKDKIDAQGKDALTAQLKEIFSDATSFDEKEGIYKVLNGNKIIGYATLAESSGYSSKIKMLVGMDMDKKIKGVRIIYQAETPGLGTESIKPKFYEQFSGMESKDIALKKYGGKIDGITGATITSGAITAGVKNALTEKLEKLVDASNPTKALVKSD